jgi:CO/xanthine dehydrogenase FAD-binding subunit
MKPAPFRYIVPETEEELFDVMQRYGGEARPLAGGQSLVPMMNFRVASPTVLVDLNRLTHWSFIRKSKVGLDVGALTRHANLEDSKLVAAEWPLITEGIGYLAHRAIRNRGTMGGSIALAYPGAELPLLFVTLGAELILRSRRGERAVSAQEFFVGELSTLLEEDEIICSAHVPAVAKSSSSVFVEVSRRHGDFAIAAAAAVIDIDESGTIQAANIGVTGGTSVPVRLSGVEKALGGHKLTKSLCADAAREGTRSLEVLGDHHYPEGYRLAVLEGTLQRTLETAFERSGQGHA